MMNAKTPEVQLASFLAKYTPEVAAQAEAILKGMRKRYPYATQLVYENYNALAIGFGPSDRASEAIFSVALFPRWVNLFFLQGKGLPDPHGLLEGNGNQARHIRVRSPAMLDEPEIRALMEEAVARGRAPFDPKSKGKLVIKSVSAKQRPRRPAESGASRAKAKAAARLGGSRRKA
ncbi:MAG TPA: DUF1801 domain-containing protein [Acidobacteriaceae bacterium]